MRFHFKQTVHKRWGIREDRSADTHLVFQNLFHKASKVADLEEGMDGRATGGQ